MLNKQQQTLAKIAIAFNILGSFLPILFIFDIMAIRYVGSLLALLAIISTGFSLYGINQYLLLLKNQASEKSVKIYNIYFLFFGLIVGGVLGLILTKKIQFDENDQTKQVSKKQMLLIVGIYSWISMALLVVIFISLVYIPIIGSFLGLIIVTIMVINFIGMFEITNAKKGNIYPKHLKGWGIYFIFFGFIVTGVFMILLANNAAKENLELPPRKNNIKRWMSFNKQSLPLLVGLLAAFYCTGLIDFGIQELRIDYQSHIHAMTRITGTYGALGMFAVFVMYLLSIIQIFNYVTFRQKRNPFSLILIAFITIIQAVTYVGYVIIIMTESQRFSDYTITASAYNSMIIFGVGLALTITALVFAFKYVDWKYVKIEE